MRYLPERTLLWGLLSGVVLALSFPRPDLAPLAWVGLIPLLLVMPRRPFAAGFAAGVGFFGLVLYWLNIVMTTYGQMHPVFSVVAYLLLVAYLALFFGTATWAACRLQRRWGLSFVFTLPILWVGLEYLRSFLLSGFPWALLGYSQQNLAVMIQSADLFGVYGLSFLLVLVNVALAALIRWFWLRQGAVPWLGGSIAALLLAANLGYGLLRLGEDLEGREKTLQVALVQGNIEQGLKWNPAFQQTTVDIYRNLSRSAGGARAPELIVWPESATPFYYQDRSFLADQVTGVARDTGAFLLFGSPAYERSELDYRYLNSAFLLSAEGGVLGRSDKVHLVPFGEYVPFGRLFPFIDKLVVGIGDFSPGVINPLPMNGSKAGVLVCFEGIFPELAREHVRQGADLLVNITNDAWFGRSSAPWQHLAMTRFRAVENRIWIARAANTGISAFITPAGRVTAHTPLFETAALTETVGLGATPTFYGRIGDLIPALFLGLGVFGLILLRFPRRGKNG